MKKTSLRIVSALLSFLAFAKAELLKADGETPRSGEPQSMTPIRGDFYMPQPTPAPTAAAEPKNEAGTEQSEPAEKQS